MELGRIITSWSRSKPSEVNAMSLCLGWKLSARASCFFINCLV